ncbi:MAG: CPBP family intramembrane metalloprotease [Clostridium sp.]|nr:CPBP family intramembrane metalloprotease [Clostridium sp.]
MINNIKNSNEIRYEKLDGILAIFMTIYISIITIIFWYLISKLGWGDEFVSNFENKMFAKVIFYIPLDIIELFPIFIILKYRNQSLKSIGINKNKILKQIIIGISLYLPLFLLNWKSTKILNVESMSIWNFMYMLMEIAFVEEVIFRGYIQQRLRGLIKNRYINLFVVAFMFGIIHLPFTLIKFDNVTFNDVVLSTAPRMIKHIYFVGVFKAGDNSILSSTITHAMNNFINTLIYF